VRVHGASECTKSRAPSMSLNAYINARYSQPLDT
jgi:hypothetical protein